MSIFVSHVRLTVDKRIRELDVMAASDDTSGAWRPGQGPLKKMARCGARCADLMQDVKLIGGELRKNFTFNLFQVSHVLFIMILSQLSIMHCQGDAPMNASLQSMQQVFGNMSSMLSAQGATGAILMTNASNPMMSSSMLNSQKGSRTTASSNVMNVLSQSPPPTTTISTATSGGTIRSNTGTKNSSQVKSMPHSTASQTIQNANSPAGSSRLKQTSSRQHSPESSQSTSSGASHQMSMAADDVHETRAFASATVGDGGSHRSGSAEQMGVASKPNKVNNTNEIVVSTSKSIGSNESTNQMDSHTVSSSRMMSTGPSMVVVEAPRSQASVPKMMTSQGSSPSSQPRAQGVKGQQQTGRQLVHQQPMVPQQTMQVVQNQWRPASSSMFLTTSSNTESSTRPNQQPVTQSWQQQHPQVQYQQEPIIQQRQQIVETEPDTTAQLEKPSGYSYETSTYPMASPMSPSQQPSGTGSAYTHTSPLSPVKQEILLAEQVTARQRQRQYQYDSMSARAIGGGGAHIEQQQILLTGGSGGGAVKSATQLPQFSGGHNTIDHLIPNRPASGGGQGSHINMMSSAAQSMGHSMALPHQPCRPPMSSPFGLSDLSQTSIQVPGGQVNDLGGSSTNQPTSPSMPPKYMRAGVGTRLRSQFVFKVIHADSLTMCETACNKASVLAGNNQQDTCRSFNFRADFAAENCELSRHDIRSLKLEDNAQFEQHTQFDFYALEPATIQQQSGPQSAAMMAGSSNSLLYSPFADPDCLDVTQSCSPDGMEFTLRTQEPFNGRIYTYGFYDSCYFDGEAATTSVLRISRPNGFPRCGTQQYGDMITNIVVVQFNDHVQTTRDKKYNLTCFFSGPGEAVVTSSYLDAKIDERSHPIQIEHLPPQNVVTSNVHLRVLYRGQPTNTIAVGDLLTFRLETRSTHHRSEWVNAHNEIFATNVIAKDPYSGRQVQLIDARGCPVDPINVFPELQRTPDGALESEFYAFKIPDSNFLIFQATVRTCKAPCEPAICQTTSSTSNGLVDSHQSQYVQQASLASGVKGGYLVQAPIASHSHLQPSSAPSWGRKKRRRRSTEDEPFSLGESVEHTITAHLGHKTTTDDHQSVDKNRKSEVRTVRRPDYSEAEEEVKEMFRVYMSRAELDRRQRQKNGQQVAVAAPIEPESHQDKTRHTSSTGAESLSLINRIDWDQTSAPEDKATLQTPICLHQVAYYALMSICISLSMLAVALLVIGLMVAKKAKFRISSPIADSLF